MDNNLIQVNVPGLGNVTLCSYLKFGQLIEAHDLADKVGEVDRKDVFTNFILSCMFVEPQKTPEHVSNFSPEALGAVTQVIVDVLKIRKEFDATTDTLPIRERFYNAHITQESEISQEILASLAKHIGSLKLPGSEMAKLSDAIQQMSALNLKISLPKIPDALLASAKQLDKLTKFAKAISITSEPLQKLIQGISQIKLPEPFFGTALLISGLDSSIIHSPTYALPPLHPVDIRETQKIRGAPQQRRLVAAYDILSQLEQSLRDCIEMGLRELHSDHWWKRGVPEDVRKDCEARKSEKEKPIDISYNPIYYAYIHDYKKIILRGDNWKPFFSSIFGEKIELEACFAWVSNVRDSVAHVRPISDDDFLMFTAAAKWIQTRIKPRV